MAKSRWKRRRPKLLSPVNSFQGAVRVIRAGADEVYCGVEIPGRLKNLILYRGPGASPCQIPTYDELERIVKYAHGHNVKVLLTVNEPFMTDAMERDLMNHVRLCLDKGVDALMVGDLGVLSMLRDMKVDAPLIASTYFVTLNSEAVGFLRKMGFSRVVLERHLTIPEISGIVNNSKIDIEVFCHAGGCSNFNGNCYLYHYGPFKLQRALKKLKGFVPPCRLSFEIYDANNRQTMLGNMPILDAITFCSLCQLQSLVETGVTGLKIVGREQDVEAQEITTKVYRELLDLLEHDRVAPDRLQKKIKSSRETFSSFYLPYLKQDFQESCCKQKRCFFSPLFTAQYKLHVRAMHKGL